MSAQRYSVPEAEGNTTVVTYMDATNQWAPITAGVVLYSDDPAVSQLPLSRIEADRTRWKEEGILP